MISHNTFDQASTSGGVTRVQHGAASPDEVNPLQSPYESTRVAGTTHRLTIGAAGLPTEAGTSGVSRHQTYDDKPTNDSVMATEQRIRGMRTVQIIPGNEASRTNLEQAVKLGLIQSMGTGEYRDVQGPKSRETQENANEPAPAGADPVQEDPGAQWFIKAEDEAYAADIEPIHQGAYDAAAALATIATLDGTDLSAAATRLARDQGIDPALAAEMVESGYQYHEDAVLRALAPEGIDASNREDFYQFARSRPRDLQNAVQQLIHARDVVGFVQLATLYRGKSAQRLG